MQSQKCPDTNNDISLPLLQNREPININNNNAYHETLKACQDKYVKNNDTSKDSLSFPTGSTIAMHCKDVGP